MNVDGLNRHQLITLLQTLQNKTRYLKILTDLTPLQKKVVFARDASGKLASRVSFISPRSGGKTYAAVAYGVYLCITAKPEEPRRVVYAHVQATSARDSGFATLLEIINKYHIKCDVNRNILQVRFDNGSTFTCYGLSTHSVDSFRGPRNDLIILDEAQLFVGDQIEKDIYAVLIPTFRNLESRIMLVGTPGETNNCLFYKIYSGKSTDFTLVRGSAYENPYSRDVMKNNLQETLKKDPNYKLTSTYLREYEAIWVVDDTEVIYRINSNNFLYEFEDDPNDKYILGVDFGFTNPTAFVLAVYNAKKHGHLIYLDSYEESQMSNQAIAQKIMQYQSVYPNLVIVGDGSGVGAHIISELSKRYRLPVQAMKKHNNYKEAAIKSWNDEAAWGGLKFFNVRDPANPDEMQIVKKIQKLTWVYNARTGKKQEGADNHICFVADTQIDTLLGKKCIQDIRLYDKILTTKGYSDVIRLIKTHNQNTISVQINDSITLTGTPNHPVITGNRGLVRLNELQNGDILWVNTEKQKLSFGTDINGGDILTHHQHQIETILEEQQSNAQTNTNTPQPYTYTGKYLKLIMVKLQTIVLSIISMAIQIITTPATWKQSNKASMLQNILQKRESNKAVIYSLQKQYQLQSNGIRVKKVENGTLNMVLKLLKRFTKKSAPLLVLCVEIFSKLRSCVKVKFAAPNVMPSNVEIVALTTFQSNAQHAERNLLAINTARPNFVATRVEKIVVNKGPQQTVYNLTVADQHEYFANSILVKNCDAMLYCREHAYNFLYRKAKPGIEFGSEEWAAQETAKMKKAALRESVWGAAQNQFGVAGAELARRYGMFDEEPDDYNSETDLINQINNLIDV